MSRTWIEYDKNLFSTDMNELIMQSKKLTIITWVTGRQQYND